MPRRLRLEPALLLPLAGLAILWLGLARGVDILGVGGVGLMMFGASRVARAYSPRLPTLAEHESSTRAALDRLTPKEQGSYRASSRDVTVAAPAFYAATLATLPVPTLRLAPGRELDARLVPAAALTVNTLAFTIIWNAFVLPLWAFLVLELVRHPGPWGAWVGVVFVTVFVVVGAKMIWEHLRRVLILSRLPRVEVSSSVAYLGDELEVVVEHPARFPITKLEVSIECREVVEYSEGSSRRAESHVVWTSPVRQYTHIERGAPRSHRETFTLTTSAPPSFKSANNRIEWSLRLVADLPNWPDYDERLEIAVLPRPTA
ncbi:MAG: hypothetical protein U0271_06280 [Polyangiaceae bacterium]